MSLKKRIYLDYGNVLFNNTLNTFYLRLYGAKIYLDANEYLIM